MVSGRETGPSDITGKFFVRVKDNVSYEVAAFQ